MTLGSNDVDYWCERSDNDVAHRVRHVAIILTVCFPCDRSFVAGDIAAVVTKVSNLAERFCGNTKESLTLAINLKK